MHFKSWALSAAFCALVGSHPAFASSKEQTEFPATYEGGSLPMTHRKVIATFDGGNVIFVQHGQRFTVPFENITSISCGANVRRRFGASVLGVVPKMRLGTTEKDYVGVTWTADTRAVEVIFKLGSREYREFLRALERSTGKKAVDATKVPTVVHYDL